MAMNTDTAAADADDNPPATTPNLTGNDPLGIEEGGDSFNDPDHIEENIPDSSRHYGGSMVHQQKSSICGWIAVIALFAVAVALGAVSLQKSNEALEIANANGKAIEENANMYMMAENNKDAPAVDYPPAPTPAPPTPSAPVPGVQLSTPNPTTPKPTPTEAPTDPHPLNPKWFQTTHADFKMFDEANEGQENTHTHNIAVMFCGKQQRELCPYDAYCPNGRGNPPFHGGPPQAYNHVGMEETQWAPFNFWKEFSGTIDPRHTEWVQIGTIYEKEGGAEGNDFGKCWRYDDFYAGEGVDIVEKWDEEYRMWILCCDVEEEEEDTVEVVDDPDQVGDDGRRMRGHVWNS